MIAGQKLREFREKRGIRPVDVATMLGIDRQRITQIEQTADVGEFVACRYIGAVLGAQEPSGETDGVVPVEAFVEFRANGSRVEL